MQKQTAATMAFMMKDLVQYIMMPKIRYDNDIGTYVSYDIAAYDCFVRDIVSVAWDVTLNRELALQMVAQFNRRQLPPDGLLEEVRKMLR